ncbi:hypothetical protein PALB_22300 [Pseudoalteromonas luteoviolacea B = ATCC 29581]|nr:hypothetical protein PALB_22300 [Pseudoalteromonas luteoviolacea B = ATCC 29581]
MKRYLSLISLLLLSGCETLSVSSLSNVSFSQAPTVCDGTYQCRVIELPALNGCASPAGFEVFSTKTLSESEVDAHVKKVLQRNQPSQRVTDEPCPTVYPVQALCIANRCESFTLGQ